MSTKEKYPKNQGHPIRVKKAKAEQARWKNNPNNKKYPADTFSVPVEILKNCISSTDCNGVNFCNGLNADGSYYPVMSVIDGEGNILAAFDSSQEISTDVFNAARTSWQEQFPVEEGNAQLFYLGEETILTNISDFEVDKYTAAFVEKNDGTDSAVLYGYHLDGMKDPGDDDDPDTAVNEVYFCPPVCQ